MDCEVVGQIRDFGSRVREMESSKQWHNYVTYYKSLNSLSARLRKLPTGSLRFEILDEDKVPTGLMVEVESDMGYELSVGIGEDGDESLFPLCHISLPEEGTLANAYLDGSSDIEIAYGGDMKFSLNRDSFDTVTPLPVPSLVPEEIKIAFEVIAEAQVHLAHEESE